MSASGCAFYRYYDDAGNLRFSATSGRDIGMLEAQIPWGDCEPLTIKAGDIETENYEAAVTAGVKAALETLRKVP